MRRVDRRIIISLLVLSALILINPLERYKEYKDFLRMTDLKKLSESVDLYIKYNSGSRVNLGSVGTVYDSSGGLTDVDGDGWIPIKFRSSGVKMKKLPLDPVNKDSFVYTFSSSSSIKYKLSSRFESKKYLDLAASDNGVSESLYEIGTDLTLKPSGEVNDY